MSCCSPEYLIAAFYTGKAPGLGAHSHGRACPATEAGVWDINLKEIYSTKYSSIISQGCISNQCMLFCLSAVKSKLQQREKSVETNCMAN